MDESSSLKKANQLMAAFHAGRPSIGAWQMLPGSNVSRVLARSGVDWVLVDLEHGNIGGALDCGAHGVLIPLLRTTDEARQVVQSAKFPPKGRRGYGNPFTFERFDPKGTSIQYLQEANDAILTMVQIETKEAFESIDEIAGVDGVDVLFIGPFDLGNNLGHPILNGDMSPELKAAIGKILAATKKAGKKCGILATSGEQGRLYAEQGFDMISVTIDYSTLETCTEREVRVAKGIRASRP
ncbi:4-hydroxy-2-oxo-heptane-1 [Escovopsis weberi]|uniref:4-hydroxy-2-oxo-heptane-1 n=1 Tax=Escovopsis weberi TaxID=150374 RepID=A0A0M8MZP8_ESCWE|nr:4-hydroxy-2-oxo-heptane-1 [Escovopsis weberi]